MLNKVVFKALLPALLLSVFVFQGFSSVATAGDAPIPSAINLQQDGFAARQKGIPVLLEFSMHGCPFCEEVEAEVLEPMLKNGSKADKVIVRRVMIDEDTEITGFDGEKISYEDLASEYGVYVTPTLVLVNGNGKATGLEMVGVTTIDFYEAYLFQAIDAALKQISIAIENASVDSPAS